MDLIQKDLKYIWHPCSQMKDYEELPPIVIERAQGIWLYDKSGRRYADIVSSWWCNLLGHCHPRISAAMKRQLDRLEHVIFANFTHEPAIELCEELSALVPKGLEKFFFNDNGSASIEVAMKMSFQYHYQTGHPEKRRFMALSNAYHGETIGALSVGGVDLYSKMYKPLLLDTIRIDGPDCYRCPYGKDRSTCSAPCFEKVAQVFQKYANVTCALLVEPLIQAAAGMRIYPPVYLQKLRRLCNEHNVHLIADEIAVGYGRTGDMFACNRADICPDMICLSKGLTGGYLPMSIVVTTQNIYDAFYADYNEHKAFLHSHTYAGNPLACSAALEVLHILKDESILETARKNAPLLKQKLIDALGENPYVGEIRSLGLINAIELVKNRETKTPFDPTLRLGYRIYKNALKRGLLLRPMGDVLYFNPPLVITSSEIEWTVEQCRLSILETLNDPAFSSKTAL